MNVRIAADTGLALTLTWDPVPNAEGFIFLLDGSEVLTDGKRHITMDGSKTSVKIAKPQDGKPHLFEVRALGRIDSGTVGINQPLAPPTTVSNSLKTGDKLIGTYQWKVETAGDCVKVEFWSDNTKLGEVAGASPYVFSFDTTKVPTGDHVFGVVEVDSAGVRHPDENRVTAHVAHLQVTVSGTPVVSQTLKAVIA